MSATCPPKAYQSIMGEFFASVTVQELAMAFAITMVAGLIKGATGFALPLIMITGLALLFDPKFAIAAMILPIVVANTYQAFSGGIENLKAAVREHWRYILVVCVMIFTTAQIVAILPNRIVYLTVGIPVVTFSIIMLIGWRPAIPPHRRRIFEWGIGTLAGIFGGLSGTWGPTTVLYLLALDVKRPMFIVVQGVVYGLGSYALLGGHLTSGLLGTGTWGISALLVLPAMAGIWAGMRIGRSLDAETFRKVTLSVLIVCGLALIRRAILG